MIKIDLDGVKKTLKEYKFPVDVIVELTANCNLKCSMCPHKNLKRKKGEMPFKTFKKIIDEVSIEGSSTRLWLAVFGEPLLLEDKLIEYIKYAKSKDINSIHLNTNGTFLNKNISEKLLEIGITEIYIGMDAYKEETYNKIRVGGNFKQTVENIETFLNLIKKFNYKNTKLFMQFIVMKENEEEVYKFKNYWLEKGAIVKIRPRLGFGLINNPEENIIPDVKRDFPCPWLIRIVQIHWDGVLSQCDNDYEGYYSPGNINKQSIKEIWNGELAKRRQKHWQNDFSHDLCKDCKDWACGRSHFYYPE
ncbi:MAG: radical SAM/SPASM domain-containing protein [Cyanobacteriota bacterium]